MRFILILAILLLSSFLHAEVDYTDVTVDGFGLSRDDALQNALIEAIKQVNGVTVDSEKAISRLSEQKKQSIDGESSHMLEFSESSAKNISETTHGMIDTYQILVDEKQEDGTSHVQLAVTIKRYLSPGNSPDNLRKIAVIPFRTQDSSFRIGGNNYAASEVVNNLNQSIVNELTQSRRFAVIDREYVNEIASEKKILQSDDVSNDEKLKLGQSLGADYLLLGTIKSINYDTQAKTIAALGESVSKQSMLMTVDFRILVMATRHVKWSDTVNIKLDNAQLKNLQTTDMKLDQAINEVSKRIVHDSLNNIYPIKILKVSGSNAIYLNQGGKMTQSDEEFEVFTPGEILIDPDNGLPIKVDGQKVAAIKIIKVMDKYSLAKLVSGELSEIQAGAIVRKSQKSRPPAVKHQRVMQPAW